MIGCATRPRLDCGDRSWICNTPLISNNHSHSDTVANEIVQALRTTCKRKATETACLRPSKVIRTVLGDQDDFDLTSSDINNVRAATYIYDKTEFVVSAYYDYRTQLITRKEFVKKACRRCGPRTEL